MLPALCILSTIIIPIEILLSPLIVSFGLILLIFSDYFGQAAAVLFVQILNVILVQSFFVIFGIFGKHVSLSCALPMPCCAECIFPTFN